MRYSAYWRQPMTTPTKNLDRRAFFAVLARGALGVGLGAMAAVLGARAIRQHQLCRRDGACPGCPLVANCSLPAADSHRRTP